MSNEELWKHNLNSLENYVIENNIIFYIIYKN
jgi:hypothetical protein